MYSRIGWLFAKNIGNIIYIYLSIYMQYKYNNIKMEIKTMSYIENNN